MSEQIHLQVRPAGEGGWEVRRFQGRQSHHPTLEAALEQAEALLLAGDDFLSTLQIQRFNGVTETRIFQRMLYPLHCTTETVFRPSMELP